MVAPYEGAISLICTIPGVDRRSAITIISEIGTEMILTAIFHMLSTGEVFNPSDLNKIDIPQEMLDKQKDKAIKQAINLLVSQGLIKDTNIFQAETTA